MMNNTEFSNRENSDTSATVTYGKRLPKKIVAVLLTFATVVTLFSSFGTNAFAISDVPNVTPLSSEFDLDRPQDIELILQTNGNTLVAINSQTGTLAYGTDFTVSLSSTATNTNTVTISNRYLLGFAEGTTVTLTFQFGSLVTNVVQANIKIIRKDNFSGDWQYDADNHWHKCLNDGCTEVADKAPHEWNDGEITVYPTTTAEGQIKYTCKVCGNTYLKVLPAITKTQTITTDFTTKTLTTKYVGKYYKIGAKAQGALSYKLSRTGVVTVSKTGYVKIVGAGTVRVTITAAQTLEYKAATKVITITVKKQNQYISISTLPKYSSDDIGVKYKLGATAKGKLSFKTNKSGVIKVYQNGKIIILAPGTVKLTIKAAATAYYNSAKMDITITVTREFLTYKTTDALYFRTGPSKSYKIKGINKKGTKLQVVAGISVKDKKGRTWVQVKIKGKYYWSCRNYMKKA